MDKTVKWLLKQISVYVLPWWDKIWQGSYFTFWQFFQIAQQKFRARRLYTWLTLLRMDSFIRILNFSPKGSTKEVHPLSSQCYYVRKPKLSQFILLILNCFFWGPVRVIPCCSIITRWNRNSSINSGLSLLKNDCDFVWLQTCTYWLFHKCFEKLLEC